MATFLVVDRLSPVQSIFFAHYKYHLNPCLRGIRIIIAFSAAVLASRKSNYSTHQQYYFQTGYETRPLPLPLALCYPRHCRDCQCSGPRGSIIPLLSALWPWPTTNRPVISQTRQTHRINDVCHFPACHGVLGADTGQSITLDCSRRDSEASKSHFCRQLRPKRQSHP